MMNRKGLLLAIIGLVAIFIPQYLKQGKKDVDKTLLDTSNPSAKLKPGIMDDVDFSEKSNPVINPNTGSNIADPITTYPKIEVNPSTGGFEIIDQVLPKPGYIEKPVLDKFKTYSKE